MNPNIGLVPVEKSNSIMMPPVRNLAEIKKIKESDLHDTALHFLLETVTQRQPVRTIIPLTVAEDHKKFLLTHPRYRMLDTVDLADLAKTYLRDRIQIGSRELAIAILLGRDAVNTSQFSAPIMIEPLPKSNWTPEQSMHPPLIKRSVERMPLVERIQKGEL